MRGPCGHWDCRSPRRLETEPIAASPATAPYREKGKSSFGSRAVHEPTSMWDLEKGKAAGQASKDDQDCSSHHPRRLSSNNHEPKRKEQTANDHQESEYSIDRWSERPIQLDQRD